MFILFSGKAKAPEKAKRLPKVPESILKRRKQREVQHARAIKSSVLSKQVTQDLYTILQAFCYKKQSLSDNGAGKFYVLSGL